MSCLDWLEKSFFLDAPVDSSQACRLNTSGFEWLMIEFGYSNGSGNKGSFLGHALRNFRRSGYQCMRGRFGAMRIFCQRNCSICCRTLGIR